jgi:DNA-binding PadR family transcriptional regulator
MGRPKIYTEEEKRLKTNSYYREYYKTKKEEYSIRAKQYRSTEKGKEALERARKKERDNLSDNYIRQNLACNLHNCGNYSLDRKSVPKELIEISRQVILAKRQLKLKKNEHK